MYLCEFDGRMYFGPILTLISVALVSLDAIHPEIEILFKTIKEGALKIDLIERGVVGNGFCALLLAGSVYFKIFPDFDYDAKFARRRRTRPPPRSPIRKRATSRAAWRHARGDRHAAC